MCILSYLFIKIAIICKAINLASLVPNAQILLKLSSKVGIFLSASLKMLILRLAVWYVALKSPRFVSLSRR